MSPFLPWSSRVQLVGPNQIGEVPQSLWVVLGLGLILPWIGGVVDVITYGWFEDPTISLVW